MGTNDRDRGRLNARFINCRVVVKGGEFEVGNGFEDVGCVGVSGDISSEGLGCEHGEEGTWP